MASLYNENGVILDWLGRTVLVLALFGVLLFDAGSVTVNYFGLSNTAEDIAVAVSTDITGANIANSLELQQEAKNLADKAGAKLVRAEMDSLGTIHIKLRRTAKTLVVGRIGAAKEWTRATAVAQVSTNSP
jgi:hypothetical protein